MDDKPSFYPPNRQAWRGWLEAHHTSQRGIWLIFYKKATQKPTVTYEEAVEEALCFGWIDSRPAKLDDERHLLYFCPRKPKSVWSKPNKLRLERLLTADQVMPAGLEAIRVAKANGSWTAIDASEAMIVPDDLQLALEDHQTALEFWTGFPPGVRKNILQWIGSAKRNETRANRIAETVRLAAENIRANQFRQS